MPPKRKANKRSSRSEYNDLSLNRNRKEPSRDYLKYLRLARRYVQKRYNLKLEELEVILFLQTEKLFSRDDFYDISCIMPWNKNRFKKLMDDGWINEWRKPKPYEKGLYEISSKGRNMVQLFCRILEGNMSISELKKNNPFMKKARYTDKVYARAIEKFNKRLNDSN
jgi:CDP-diacylglycerol pyrophosphatase